MTFFSAAPIAHVRAGLLSLVFLGTFLALGLVGCSADEDAPAATEAEGPDNTAEVQADYAAEPAFYGFKTPQDLPPDLVWEDGLDQPEIGSPQAKKGGTQYIALPDFPRTLRTAGPDSNGAFRNYILDNVVMSSAQLHPDTLEFYPALAEAWAVDEANSTVYVRLNPQARWSDGEPVTVEDFFFMFWFYKSPYIRAPWYNNWYGSRYTNITRYDERTFSVTTAERKPDFVGYVLALSPLPRHFFTEVGEDYVERYQWRIAPTTSPYVLADEDLKKGRSITLRRDPDWWARDNKYFRYRFNPDRIQFSVIRDSAKMFEAFKRGDLDEFGLGQAEYWYEKLPDADPAVQAGYIAKSMFYNEYPRPPMGLWINMARPVLDDLNVRLGIQHASNWQLVIDQYFRGDAERLPSPEAGYGDFDHPSLRARGFDIEQAQAYFAAAGYTQRGPDGILVNEAGQKLAFTLSTGYERLADVLTILKQEAAKAGLEFRIEVLDSTSAWKKVQEKKHDIHFVAFGRALEMYPRYWEHYHSDNAYENAFLEDGSLNPERTLKTQTNNLESFALYEMDALIDRYRASSDREEMIRLSHRMLELHYEQASFVPGYYRPYVRIGHWRWLRYPEFFNHRHISDPGQLWVHWIDTELKETVQAAQKNGETFPPMINVYDKWK